MYYECGSGHAPLPRKLPTQPISAPVCTHAGRRVEAQPPHVLVNPQRMMQERVHALFALHAIAQAARDADRHRGIGMRQVHAVRVDELLRRKWNGPFRRSEGRRCETCSKLVREQP